MSKNMELFGATLLVAGLVGHLFAAQAIGGTFVAYQDHIGASSFLPSCLASSSRRWAGTSGKGAMTSRC
jgi:hypothetical protein